MTQYILGIDPGKRGGLALLTIGGGVVFADPMPPTERDLCDWLEQQPIAGDSTHAFIEKVASRPTDGVVQAFTFGKGYGGLLMALTARHVPFTEVTPQTWQKALGCLSGGDKNVTKRRAQQLFPNFPITHPVAEALLIARYGCDLQARGNHD